MARATGVTAAAIVGALWLTGAGLGQSAKPPRADPKGLAAFARIASVLESPRCTNCHPRGNRPAQGDDRHLHLTNVQRGPTDRGLPAMTSASCHQRHNDDRAGIPGAPHWRLAPKSMGWSGLSRAQLCTALLDRSKNGGRRPAALVTHMTTDALVRWAWQPGRGRTPPPLSRDDLHEALLSWVAAGTPCPN